MLKYLLVLTLLLSACGADVVDDVGVDKEPITILNSLCANNQIGVVTTSTPLGKGAAMCVASESNSAFYACSGNFTAGTCTLALGQGLATYKVTNCGAWVEQVPWPGTGVFVTTANRCFVNYGTKTGYVYAGLRNTDNLPVYVYSVPSSQWHAKTDFVVPSQATYWYGF